MSSTHAPTGSRSRAAIRQAVDALLPDTLPEMVSAVLVQNALSELLGRKSAKTAFLNQFIANGEIPLPVKLSAHIRLFKTADVRAAIVPIAERYEARKAARAAKAKGG
jgi:hypothetical protein